MLDKERIKIMTVMAVYDKHSGRKDREAEKYFRGSYIYRKNCLTRIGVFAGVVVLFMFYVVQNIFITEFDFANFNYMGAAIKWAIFLIAMIIIYTVVGTIKYGREYDLADKRLKGYNYLVKMLEKTQEKSPDERE